MAGHSSRAGKRADTYAISDHPHLKYFDSGVPIAYSAGNMNARNIIAKEITYSTLGCPECGATGYYDEDQEAFCPECGVRLKDTSVPRTDNGDEVFSDAKAAGRIGTKN